MTYAVTDNCQLCRFTDCASCFAGSQELLTAQGARKFADVVNTDQWVLTEKGFVLASIREFGHQMVYDVVFRPETEVASGLKNQTGPTLRPNRTPYTRTVRVTRNHIWPLKSGEESTYLEVGDVVTSKVYAAAGPGNSQWEAGLLHGLIFGDGSTARTKKRRNKAAYRLGMFGEKLGQWANRFPRVKFYASDNAKYSDYRGTALLESDDFGLKELPVDKTPDYIGGFFEGWASADGYKSKDRSLRLLSTNHEALDWAELNAPLAGYTPVGRCNNDNRLETNKGVRTRLVQSLRLSKKEVFWRVMSIIAVAEELVYCAVVPSVGRFTLAGGLYTHNCCPVDAFKLGPEMVFIDPNECIDCFSADSTFLTSDGPVSFAEMVGKSPLVLTALGWKKADVKAFGKQELFEVVLRPAFKEKSSGDNLRITTRNSSRYTRKVIVTASHKWVTHDGQVIDKLEVGTILKSNSSKSLDINGSWWKEGLLHGLVFGDGSWNKQEKRSGLHLHYVQLYGPKMGRWSDQFEQVNWSPSCAEHPGYAGTGVVRSLYNLKLIPTNYNPDYIRGFVEGWLSADGCDYPPSRVIKSTNHAALEWLNDVAPLAGYLVIGSGEESNDFTNYGARRNRLRWLTLTDREVFWRVSSIVPVGMGDTFCVVEPETHTFTLTGGILTHNCGACVPVCPVNAIFWEIQIPEDKKHWIKINEDEHAKWPLIKAKIDPLPGAEARRQQLIKDGLLPDDTGVLRNLSEPSE